MGVYFVITDNIVYCDLDYYKRVGYVVNLYDCNYKNDLDATIADTSIEENHINSICVWSNIDDERQNLTLELLPAISNIKTTILALNTTTTIISYCNKDWLIPLNDWEDSHYFIATFYYLFPLGNRNYLKQQKRPMLFETWAKWTLKHHFH